MNWRRYIGWTFLGLFVFMILWVIASFAEMFVPIDPELVHPVIRDDDQIAAVVMKIKIIGISGTEVNRGQNVTGFHMFVTPINQITMIDGSVITFSETEDGNLRLVEMNRDDRISDVDQLE